MHMEDLFYSLAIVQIAVGGYLIWQGLQWLGYARRRMFTDPGFNAPRVAVLCPCKGVEPGLERNLVALTEFNHQNYEVFFILASGSDPAAGILKRVAASSRPKAHVVIAEKPEGCGEKVNNLRVAIEQLPPDFDVLVSAINVVGCTSCSALSALVPMKALSASASKGGVIFIGCWFPGWMENRTREVQGIGGR